MLPCRGLFLFFGPLFGQLDRRFSFGLFQRVPFLLQFESFFLYHLFFLLLVLRFLEFRQSVGFLLLSTTLFEFGLHVNLFRRPLQQRGTEPRRSEAAGRFGVRRGLVGGSRSRRRSSTETLFPRLSGMRLEGRRLLSLVLFLEVGNGLHLRVDRRRVLGGGRLFFNVFFPLQNVAIPRLLLLHAVLKVGVQRGFSTGRTVLLPHGHVFFLLVRLVPWTVRRVATRLHQVTRRSVAESRCLWRHD
mmetsp:Transcript_15690/g.27276  ORF Transcript_15690/g.27276 Transcript_15690/m.27276 type:complete len:244 (+) Transcript_15690:595-1326(+)